MTTREMKFVCCSLLLFTCLALAKSEHVNQTIELQCQQCVRNGTLGFYKSVWLPKLPADYFCQRSADKKIFGVIVEQACKPDECERIDVKPFTNYIPFGTSCNSILLPSDEWQNNQKDIAPSDKTFIEVLTWVAGGIAIISAQVLSFIAGKRAVLQRRRGDTPTGFDSELYNSEVNAFKYFHS